MTARPGAAPGDWGIHVNEVGIFATGIARDRWLDFWLRCKDGRLTELWTGLCGSEWHVMCGTRADAVEAYGLFLEVGFHKAHVKVARLSACQAKVKASQERIDAMFEQIRAEALAGAR